MESYFSFPITTLTDLNSFDGDGIILITWSGANYPTIFNDVIQQALRIDEALESEMAVFSTTLGNNKKTRLIYAPTGKIDPDYDDVRIFGRTAKNGMKRALKAGVKKPLVILQKHSKFTDSELVTLLGILEALYVPLQLREDVPNKKTKVNSLAVYSESTNVADIVQLALKLEVGRIVARDIGGSDPERMAAPKVQEYVENIFKNSNVKVDVISDSRIFKESYPLFQAVNRCAEHAERHRGRIIKLTYVPNSTDPIEKTLFLIGKGVTYDTGGCDIKAGGVMAGMSRDKCGAAAVAGFLQMVNLIKPKNVKVIGVLCMVRNSVGFDAYVSDEVITARSGARVRVGNTDAEGRMAMADALYHMKELAKNETNAHLYTVATLTGHAVLAMGHGYSIVLDNGPARKANHAQQLAKQAEEIGDPFEISTIRKEDIEFHRGQTEGDDILQCNNLPSSRTPRGHQTPAGFLLLASGLINHGSESDYPLRYSHLDIAGSAGDFPEQPTGAPALALAKMFLLQESNKLN